MTAPDDAASGAPAPPPAVAPAGGAGGAGPGGPVSRGGPAEPGCPAEPGGPAEPASHPDQRAPSAAAPVVAAGPAVTYSERWTAPLRVWLAVLTVALVAAATIHAGADGLRAVVPYLLLPLLGLAYLARASRGQVRIADGVLSVPGARIPLDQLGGVRELDREGTRRVRGPLAQPRAFVATRAWLTSSVQVRVEDPDDDTPYWLVGTRHPDRLAAALQERPSSTPAP